VKKNYNNSSFPLGVQLLVELSDDNLARVVVFAIWTISDEISLLLVRVLPVKLIELFRWRVVAQLLLNYLLPYILPL
jgi:hypothetical protein